MPHYNENDQKTHHLPDQASTVFFDPLQTRRKPSWLAQTPNRAYIAGVIATDLAAATAPIKGAPDFSGTINGHSLVNEVWNFTDGFCNLVTVAQLCMDEDIYHPAKKLKIGLNLIAGIGLIAFTDNAKLNMLAGIAGCNHFAAPVFALATLCDLLSARLDYYYSTEKGFLEAMIGKVEFLQNRIKKLESEGKDAEHFKVEKSKLLEKIRSVCRVYYNTPKFVEYKRFVDKQLTRLENILQQDQPANQAFNKCPTIVLFNQPTLFTKEDFTRPPNSDDDVRYNLVENNRQQIHKANTIKLITKSLSFAGMLMQCLPTILLLSAATSWCPIASLAITVTSLLLITMVACAYAYDEYQNQQKTQKPHGSKLKRSNSMTFFKSEDENRNKKRLSRSQSYPNLQYAK